MPAGEVAIHGLPWRKVHRQGPPGAAGAIEAVFTLATLREPDVVVVRVQIPLVGVPAVHILAVDPESISIDHRHERQLLGDRQLELLAGGDGGTVLTSSQSFVLSVPVPNEAPPMVMLSESVALAGEGSV